MKRFRWSREIPALVTAFLIVFCFLSLISFDAGDYPEWQLPARTAPVNWCGPAGAWVAITLFHWLGYGCYPLLALIGIWAVRFFRPRPIEDPWLRVLGTISLGVMACAGLALVGAPTESAQMPGHGGIVGVGVAEFLGAYFGPAGRVLVIGTLLLLTFLFAANVMLINVLLQVREKVSRIRLARQQAREAKSDVASKECRQSVNKQAAKKLAAVPNHMQ